MSEFAPTDCATVTVKGHITGDSNYALNVFHLHYLVAMSANDIANAVWEAWNTIMPAVYNEAFEVVQIRAVLDIGTEAVNNDTIAGTEASGGASPQVAYLVKKNTEFAGRANRGRMYLPGVGEAKVTSAGFVEASFRDDIETAMGAIFFSALPADDLQLVVAHRTGGTYSDDIPAVIDLSVDPKVATQRRRLR